MKSPDGSPSARAWHSRDQSLLAQLQSFFGPRYAAFVVVLGLALIVLLALAAYAQGASWPRVSAVLWLLGLDPAILVYILAVHPFMYRGSERAMRSLEALATHVEAEADGRAMPASRGGEWVAMSMGALVGLALAYRVPGAEGWLRLYAEATSALTFALLATVIYGSITRSRHLAARSRAGLQLNVFDGHLLTPFARWGQSLSLVFVGGISLSLLFQSSESLRSIEGVIVYGSLVVVALTLFFTSMWTIHVALAEAQDKELVRVHRDLAAAREALLRHRTCGSGALVQEAYFRVVILGVYEQQVLHARTWPFNPTILRRVFASAVAPLVVYLVKLAFSVGGGL